MNKNIENIYNDLLNHVTEKKLKEISVDVIGRYKAKDLSSLLEYADILEFDASGMNISRLFARVIQNYHPDKTALILSGIEENFRNKKIDELLRLKRIYIFKKNKSSAKNNKYDIDIKETYSFDDDYFDQSEKASSYDYRKDEFEFDENPDKEFDEDINQYEYGFIEAINKLVFGGIDDSITIQDLMNIEGELDLSDSEILDLKGIESCRNVTILNLSGNNIEKIDRLSGLEMLECLYLSDNDIESVKSLENLENLKELDISFNNIEDISSLLKLKELIYVNLIGNPVKTKDIIKELEERGVIVIY